MTLSQGTLSAFTAHCPAPPHFALQRIQLDIPLPGNEKACFRMVRLVFAAQGTTREMAEQETEALGKRVPKEA